MIYSSIGTYVSAHIFFTLDKFCVQYVKKNYSFFIKKMIFFKRKYTYNVVCTMYCRICDRQLNASIFSKSNTITVETNKKMKRLNCTFEDHKKTTNKKI